ncbi:hypothetical protein HK096_004356, partial [Nowakowskiella sp. JEL0078]
MYTSGLQIASKEPVLLLSFARCLFPCRSFFDPQKRLLYSSDGRSYNNRYSRLPNSNPERFSLKKPRFSSGESNSNYNEVRLRNKSTQSSKDQFDLRERVQSDRPIYNHDGNSRLNQNRLEYEKNSESQISNFNRRLMREAQTHNYTINNKSKSVIYNRPAKNQNRLDYQENNKSDFSNHNGDKQSRINQTSYDSTQYQTQRIDIDPFEKGSERNVINTPKQNKSAEYRKKLEIFEENELSFLMDKNDDTHSRKKKILKDVLVDEEGDEPLLHFDKINDVDQSSLSNKMKRRIQANINIQEREFAIKEKTNLVKNYFFSISGNIVKAANETIRSEAFVNKMKLQGLDDG